MITQRLDAALLGHVLRTRRLYGWQDAAVFSARENPPYRPRSPNSSYYMPRVFVFGHSELMGPQGRGAHRGSCDGKGGPYSAERVASAKL